MVQVKNRLATEKEENKSGANIKYTNKMTIVQIFKNTSGK